MNLQSDKNLPNLSCAITPFINHLIVPNYETVLHFVICFFFCTCFKRSITCSGQITNQTSNRAILAQRFTALNTNKTSCNHGVLIGIPDLDISTNRRAVDFSYQKTINFTISYSALNNTFSNVTEMVDDSTKRSSRNITINALSRFLGDSKASKLGFMNFMQMQLNIGDNNTSVGISNLKLNGRDITGSYTANPNDQMYWHVVNSDFGDNFILTGTIKIDGDYVAGDNANMIEFDFGYSSTLSPSIAPVYWGNINVEQKSNVNVINWNTEREENNDRFIVERGTDGINFTGIGLINGAGNRTLPSYYNFSDNEIAEGLTYYRIKQVDMDGRVNYSVVIPVTNTSVAVQQTAAGMEQGMAAGKNIKMNNASSVSKSADADRIK